MSNDGSALYPHEYPEYGLVHPPRDRQGQQGPVRMRPQLKVNSKEEQKLSSHQYRPSQEVSLKDHLELLNEIYFKGFQTITLPSYSF